MTLLRHMTLSRGRRFTLGTTLLLAMAALGLQPGMASAQEFPPKKAPFRHGPSLSGRRACHASVAWVTQPACASA